MKRISWILAAGFLCAGSLAAPAPAVAEVLEEIVALVDGDIITKSELESEEQAMTAEIYRRFTGEELDRRVQTLRQTLLVELIDRKILLHRAERTYDIDRMADAFYRSFREQQNIEDDAEFERILAREGMTMEDLRKRLLEMFAPDEVIRYEVSSRIAVSDKEVDTYYAEHQEEFARPDEVSLREIVILADSDQKRQERRAEALQARQRALEEDFAEVAKELSEAGTREEGGLLGPLGRGDLSPELEELAFSLPLGEVSELLEMPHGFHILRIESRQAGAIAPLEEVRDALRHELENRQYAEAMKTFMGKARAESDWCVKPKYMDRLPPNSDGQTCKEM
jgi:parvulin-like peptidyl-prolyl isomerase